MSFFAQTKTWQNSPVKFLAKSEKPLLNEVGLASRSNWYKRYGIADVNPDDLIAKKGISYLSDLERDTHLSSCLRTRRQKLIAKGWHISAPASDEDERLTEFVRFNLTNFLAKRSKNGFDGDILGMMDAIGKGFSLSEIVWEQIKGGKWDGYWGISAIKKKEAEDYGFKTDAYGNIENVVYVGDYSVPKTLNANKFVHVIFGPDDENPYGNSSTSKVAFWVLLKKNSAKFWAIFEEKFAMPTIIGKTPKNASSEDKTKIEDFIENLQSLAGAQIPENFVIEFLEATRRSEVTYDNFIERCNKEISKEIIGATMTIEEGSKGQGSYAHASVNADVLEVYTFFDEVMIAQTVNNQIIRRLIDYNFFDVPDYPSFAFNHDWFADIVSIAQGLEALTRMGVGIPVDWIYKRTGIPKPQPGESITELLKSVINEPVSGLDNRAKAPGFAEPIKKIAQFAEEKRELNFFEKRGQLAKIEKTLDKLEENSIKIGAYVFDDIFSNVLKTVTKKIESEQGKALQTVPKFAANIGELKKLLTDAVLASHLVGYYYTGKEVGAEKFVEEVEIGFLKEAVDKFKKLIPKPKSWYEKTFNFYDERCFHVAGLAKADIEKIFNNALVSLQDGWSMQDFERVIERMKIEYTGEAFGKDQTGEPMKASHLKTIFRTNMMKAYRSGKNELYEDPDVNDVLWGYTYSAILDGRERPSHGKLDGITRAKNDVFWQKYDPPWDYGCRCMKFAVLKSDIQGGLIEATADGKMPAMNITEGW